MKLKKIMFHIYVCMYDRCMPSLRVINLGFIPDSTVTPLANSSLSYIPTYVKFFIISHGINFKIFLVIFNTEVFIYYIPFR